MNIKEAYERLYLLLPNEEFKIGVEIWKFEHNKIDVEWSIYLCASNARFTDTTLEALMQQFLTKLKPKRGEIDEVVESTKGVV